MQIVLTSEVLLAAYAQGIFPMAERADSPYVHWYCPEKRGQLSIDKLHIPRSLRKIILRGGYDIRINSDFRQVIQSCARKRPERPESWINAPILEAFCKLHTQGHAHSVEYWQEGEMRGCLYGLAIGGAFFGESMFSEEPNASKICLVHLAARLWATGFDILDTQFTNPHLQQFGVYEVSYQDYMRQLASALEKSCEFTLRFDEDDLVRRYFQERS